MFEGLDSIDWSTLTHAHGPATDVPKLLRSLLSDDADQWMQASATLHETIWHQGTVFPAAAAAIPFLFELLSHPGVHHSRHPLRGSPSDDSVSAASSAAGLLCAIATGESRVQRLLRNNADHSLERERARWAQNWEQVIENDCAMMESIRQAIAGGLHHLVPYLSDPASDIRSWVAEALGRFPEHRSWLSPALESALQSEPDEYVRHVLAQSKTRLTFQ